jgi:multidrug resistance efflux pump
MKHPSLTFVAIAAALGGCAPRTPHAPEARLPPPPSPPASEPASGPAAPRFAFVLEATTRQTAAAPFDGVLGRVSARPGDAVTKGKTVLGELDTRALGTRLTAARAEHDACLRRKAAATRQGKPVLARLAAAEAEAAAAEISMLERLIARGRILAPLTGVVTSAPGRGRAGAAVRAGDALFEVVSLESLVAVLSVPPGQVREARVGRGVTLVFDARPDEQVACRVERVRPAARATEGGAVLDVVAVPGQRRPWMRPGMAGTAVFAP